MSKESPFCAQYCSPRCLPPICTDYCSDSCPPLLPSPLHPTFPSYHPPPNPRADSPISGPGVALITITAASFFLITYYIIHRRCQQWQHPSSAAQNSTPADNDSNHGGTTAPARHSSPSNGLDDELINKIAVYSYCGGRDNGVVSDASCSVCLSEFREDESLRLLPNCSHAFHVHCIDTWLKAHSNCPLCRVCVDISANSPPLQAAATTELQREDAPVMRRSLSMSSAGDAGSQSSWVVDGMSSSVGCSGGEGSSRRMERARVPIDRSVSFGRLVCTSPETRVNKPHIVSLV